MRAVAMHGCYNPILCAAISTEMCTLNSKEYHGKISTHDKHNRCG